MAKREQPPTRLVEGCRPILEGLWQEVCKAAESGGLKDRLQGPLREDVKTAMASATKSYRYVLPT